MAFKCVIFDFDGTLADTEESALSIYNTLAEKYKYKKITKEELNRLKHLHIKDIIEIVNIPIIKVPKIIKEGQKLLRQEIAQIKAFDPNFKEILNELAKGVEVLGIITSNSEKNVKKFIKFNDIKSMEFVISSPLMSKEVKILKIAKKYKLNKDEILYVGDERRDIISSKKAGIKCAAVTWGYNHRDSLEEENPDYIINNFSELLEIVK